MVVKDFYRSILTHFNDSVSLPCQLFRGSDDDSWVELRILGPNENRRHPNNVNYALDVDCLVQVSNRNNIYALADAVDEVIEAFTCISTDNGNLVPGNVRVVPFGFYSNTQHQRAAVVGEYTIYIEGLY